MYNNNKKEKIKVIVVTGEDDGGAENHRIYDENTSSYMYNGYSLDIFNKIKNHKLIKDKYDFEVSYTTDNFPNYNKVIKNVSDSNYDLAIGLFTSNKKRISKVDVCRPILLNRPAIIMVPKLNNLSLFYTMMESIGKLIIVMVIVGIFIGVILFFGNPERKKVIELESADFFWRSIITGIASMFGEMGFVSENASPNIKGLCISIITLLVALHRW